MEYQTQNNLFPPIPVHKDNKSRTVPDMSFTPREIISKFSRGEKVPLGFKGLFDSEDSNLDGYDPDIFTDDPTRDPNFDFGDYVEEKHALHERQRAARLRSKVKGVSDSKREASSKELSASDATKSETISGEVGTPPTVQEG